MTNIFTWSYLCSIGYYVINVTDFNKNVIYWNSHVKFIDMCEGELPSGFQFQDYNKSFCSSCYMLKTTFFDSHTIAMWRHFVFNQLLPLLGLTLLAFSWSRVILIGHSSITRYISLVLLMLVHIKIYHYVKMIHYLVSLLKECPNL